MAIDDDVRRALIIVDVQPAFCENGALGVEGGNATAERIADFVTDNADEYEYIVTTQDWHINPGKHFSDTPDFVDTWPPHAVAGTAEAELHEAVASLPVDESVKKGQYSAAYSGFEGHSDGGESLEDVLRQQDIQALDIVGIAESHCVMETALDGIKKGWPVRVFSDLTVPVSEDLGIQARKEMDEAGVDQLSSTEAFGFYEEPEDEPIPGEDSYEQDAYSYDSDDDSDDLLDESFDEYNDSYGDSDIFGDGDDIDLDDPLFDFDDDFDDTHFDFSSEVSDSDFDFSDIDLNEELK